MTASASLRTFVGPEWLTSGQADPLWATTAVIHRAATRARAVVMAPKGMGTGLGDAGEVITRPATRWAVMARSSRARDIWRSLRPSTTQEGPA
jgi:hypothetical protein